MSTDPTPGQPVTNADEFSPWVASIVSAADIIRAYLDREDPDVSRLLFNQDVEGMAMALDEAGRLLPPDADTRPGGWAVRVTMHNGVVSIRHGDDGFVTRESAERTAAYARRHRTVAGAEVVTRSEWVGPWVPVPTTPDRQGANLVDFDHDPDCGCTPPCGHGTYRATPGASVPTTKETP